AFVGRLWEARGDYLPRRHGLVSIGGSLRYASANRRPVSRMSLRSAGRRRRHSNNRIVAISWDNCVGDVAEARGGVAGFDGPDAAPDLATEHADPAIRRAEVLQAVDRDRPLRDLRFVVSGAPLTSLVGIRGDLPGKHNVATGPPRRRHTL